MTVFSVGRECFAVLGKSQGGPQNLPGFGDKPTDFRGLTQENGPLILGADARLFSWETLAPPALVFYGPRKDRGARRVFPVLEAKCLISGG